MKTEKVTFKINSEIIENYVNTINSLKTPMNQIKKMINKKHKQYESIAKMNEEIQTYSKSYPNDKTTIFIDAIIQIMNANNGMLSTRMIEPLDIKRQYLSIMKKNNMIDNVSRGIYCSTDSYEDSYFALQQKYKKIIFSHMNALYFYGLTEEFPDSYTITVPQRYHADKINEKCRVFYVSDEIYELGITEAETPYGNKVRTYDKERCICDIIRSKRRMDYEQVEKSIKKYLESKDKNVVKLYEYAKKMKIEEKVMKQLEKINYEQ